MNANAEVREIDLGRGEKGRDGEGLRGRCTGEREEKISRKRQGEERTNRDSPQSPLGGVEGSFRCHRGYTQFPASANSAHSAWSLGSGTKSSPNSISMKALGTVYNPIGVGWRRSAESWGVNCPSCLPGSGFWSLSSASKILSWI